MGRRAAVVLAVIVAVARASWGRRLAGVLSRHLRAAVVSSRGRSRVGI